MTATVATWVVAGLATLGVIVRPFGWPEAVWATAGATILIVAGLLAPAAAWAGIAKGHDVYLFLAGMMLLAELGRREGLFQWLAAFATAAARGSGTRLFCLVYVVGIAVTVFLSNDATAVVLTPAVFAATQVAGVRNPLPYLFSCAFIANAASFVLPISNPANLVVFGGGTMPPLGEWLAIFTLPSLLAIGATFALLWATQRRSLAAEQLALEVPRPPLSRGGRGAATCIVAAAIILVSCSAWGIPLGPPTLAAGLLTAVCVLVAKREGPGDLLRNVSWDVFPLVAGLFVFVEALDRTGVIRALADLVRDGVAASPAATAGLSGLAIGFGSNLVNNLPAGLVAGSAVEAAAPPRIVAAAILIGVDLGPNLSITGSLATILWLTALRREGVDMSAGRFLALGLIVMPPALFLALAGLLPLAWRG